MSIKLFFAPQMQKMAGEIAVFGKGLVNLGTIRWDRYKDGFPNTIIEQAEALHNCDVAFLASFETMADIPEQLFALNTLTRRYKVRSLKLMLFDYPTGTKDRWEEEGEVVTAFELANLMGCISPARSGPVDLGIFDIHALQEESYFPDSFHPPDRLSVMPLLKDMLSGYEDASIIYPDEGAYKRYKKYFIGMNEVICEKRRVGEKRMVTIKEGNPKNRHCVIVDDRIISGGTIIQCKDTLFAAGAETVSAFAAHGAFVGESWKKFMDSGFSEVWISDSCPTMAEKLKGVAQFRIASLAHVASEWILQDVR